MSSAVVSSAAQRIERDTTCFRCDYNLRGLSIAGDCPECGASVETTLRKLEDHGDPKWLRKVRRGVDLMLCSTGFGVVAFIAAMVLLSRAAGAGMIVTTFVTLVTFKLMLVLFCVGVWLVTTSETTAYAARANAAMRSVARWSSGLLAILLVLLAVVGYFARGFSESVALVYFYPLCVLAAASTASFGHCCRSVLRRIGEASMGDTFYFLGMIGCWILLSLALLPPLVHVAGELAMMLLALQAMSAIVMGSFTFVMLVAMRGTLSQYLSEAGPGPPADWGI